MRKNQEVKSEVVEKINEKLGRAKAVVFADYRGLTHHQLEDMRKSLRAIDAEVMIAKNTLLKRALVDSKLPVNEEGLEQPTAAFFMYNDAIAGLKEIYKSVKTLKLPVVKFAVFEGKEYDAASVQKLSALPAREVLIAQVVGQMKSPLYGLHRSLQWNLQGLTVALNAIAKQKEAQG